MSNYGGGYGQGGYDNGGYGQGGYNNQGGYGGGNRYGGNQNPYAQQGRNPYDQRDNQYNQQTEHTYARQQNSHAQRQQPGGNPYAQQGRYNGAPQESYAEGDDVEMGLLNGSTQRPILDEVQDISTGIDSINKNLETLRGLQKAAVNDVNTSSNSPANRQLDSLSADTMNLYRNFTKRIQKLKGMPGAGDAANTPQIGRVERKLKDAIRKYQEMDADYRKQLTDRMARDYMNTRNPNEQISIEEARAAVGDGTNTQIYSQALLQSDRRGESQTALRNVQNRHEAIQKIERQVIELAQLFEDMNALVVQQEPTVARINEQSENVHQDVTNANEQLTGAVDKARAARKKKWICLGIVVLILVIIAIILAIIFGVVKPGQQAVTNPRI